MAELAGVVGGEGPVWPRAGEEARDPISKRSCLLACCRRAQLLLFAIAIYIACLAGVLPVLSFWFWDWHRGAELSPVTDVGITSFEHVTFPSYDTIASRRVDIEAVYFPVQRPSGCPDSWLGYRAMTNSNFTVIAQHGLSGSALKAEGGSSTLRMAVKPLLCAGFNVLAPDMRNHGHSSNVRPISSGYQEAADVLVAARWLATQQNVSRESIFLWGQSLGGAAVAHAASRDARIRALAIEAPPASCGLVYGGVARRVPDWLRLWIAWWHKTLSVENPYNVDLLREARFIAADVFHSHGYDDTVVPFKNAELLRDAFEGRAPVVDVHTGVRKPRYSAFFHHGLHVSSWHFDEYFTKLLGFYAAAAASATAGARSAEVAPSASVVRSYPVTAAETQTFRAVEVGQQAQSWPLIDALHV